MPQLTTPPLVVYEASAGSGKTFTLAAEYISLLVENPQAYRQTLAVTFTNKATEEMKTRILSQLYGIWKGQRRSDSYRDFVCKKLGVSPEYARRQAGLALHGLLHNYSYFRVETIDSFFQSVLRNLAHELDLTTNLRIGLNDVQVEEQAVDELIDRLTTNDVVLKWLMNYIVENISDDRSWNVIGQIKHFGRTIFSDQYKSESDKLKKVMGSKGFFDQYVASLRSLQRQSASRMKDIGDRFLAILQQHGLDVSDLSYGKSGVGGLFVKLSNGQFDPSVLSKRVTESVGQPEKWCKKTHARSADIITLATSELDGLLRTTIDEQPRQWCLYQSATLTLRHLNQLRLLETIETRVREQNRDANLFLLSDTQRLLHEMIDGSDSPFIFEKIGTQLEHIMIDEFQDTSTVQWDNFKVLLNETMSHKGASNLIVGDVKQSIYRWRSGDWRLLAGIESQFAEGMVLRKPLKFNYRSCRNIIDFNNAFFTQAAELESVAAYDSIKQEVPESKESEGLVNIKLLPQSNYQAATLQLLCQQVTNLLGSGIQPSQIAILLRSNAHISLIANYFMSQLPDVPLVSDEAFRLDASIAVNTIVQAMRLLQNPNDLVAKGLLAKVWSGRPLHEAPLDDLLPQAFTAHTDELSRMPLYDLAERLYAIFSLERYESQSAYVCTFFDHITSFVDEHQGDLTTFIKEWDERLNALTIQSPKADGLRLISIHKSKGLEFPNVIVPFCDWRMEHSDILWCKPDEEPFSELPLVPVDYGASAMKGTIYEHHYEEEHQQTTVDNLNLLYVAFTRASCNLFVMGRRDAKSSRSVIIEQVLPKLKLKGGQLQGVADKGAILEYSFGSLAFVSDDKEHDDDEPNVLLTVPQTITAAIRPCTPKAVFVQSNQSRLFTAADDTADEQQKQQAYIQMGNVLHQLFSTIRTVDDIDHALQQLEGEGIIYDDELTRERLTAMLRTRLADPRVAGWFFADGQTQGWSLFNECSIVFTDPATGQVVQQRPDRVLVHGNEATVIDFKFGARRDIHHDQVRRYMQLLGQMGYAPVKGFLWYVYSNQIIDVKND